MDHSTPVSPADLLPAELAGGTVESLYAMHGPDRAWGYWLILGGLIGALGCLPLIRVDVSVRAPGVVRSATGRVELHTAVSGRIGEVRARDNDAVARGQILLVLTTGELDEQLRRSEALRQEKELWANDLGKLLADGEQAGRLGSAALRHELLQFRAQLDAYRLAEAKAASELARYTTLADKGIATRQELDNTRFEAERLAAESRLFREQTRARWAGRLKEERTAQDDLVSAIRRLEEEKNRQVIRAPVDGVLVGFSGWSAGAQVLAGQNLGAVSSRDRLQIESQVSSRDIGLVKPGQRVRLQIDAYPYTQWGMLEGEVESIGGDQVAADAGGPAFFKVLIRPAAAHLVLPNGVRGELKQGLTLTARYVVARRSLLQILYEDASAWLNPQENLGSLSTGHP
jgi:membrane fusion protein, peptide pheromone/bacteriocin exporter